MRNPAVCNGQRTSRAARVNGFDFDGSARTLSFFGACRPASAAAQAAVSYRYWVDSGEDPNGKPPCFEDPKYGPTEPDHCEGNYACSAQDACVCQPPPSGCPAGQAFDTTPPAPASVQIG